MRPLLVSLALLLLALCRQSAGSPKYDIQSFNTESSTSTTSVSFFPKEKKAAVSAAISKPKVAKSYPTFTPAMGVKLFELMPNTILLTAFEAAEIGGNIPFLMKSLYNGMYCDFKTATDEKFNEIIYGHGTLTQPEKDAERADSKKDDPNGGKGLDCDAPAPTNENAKAVYECFCTGGKGMFYCAFQFLKNQQLEQGRKEAVEAAKHGVTIDLVEKPCRDVTVPALVNSGALGKLYDLDSFSKNNFDDAFNGKVDAYSTEQMKAILCDALKPNVEAAVKAVYASDGLYWITESLLYTVIFGASEESMTEACEAEKDFKEQSEYGKCVCGQDTGFTFCIYKVIAKAFEDAGYLKCDGGAPAFVAEKKPSALPQLDKPKGKGGKKSSSATTTFSLLPPAAAAAAMLLLRQ